MTTRSRASVTITLSLAFLAMTLDAPALAGDGKAADRGVKSPVVEHSPSPTTLPISERHDGFDKATTSSVRNPGIGHTLVRLMFTLAQGARF